MEENNRKVPPVQRHSIDGVKARRPNPENQASRSNGSPSPEVQQQIESQKLQQNPEKNPGKPKKKRGSLLVISLAIIVLIGLSALAVYVGLRQNAQGADSNQPAEQTSTENPAVDNEELIDQTINEIDQLNNQSDSSGEGLSDAKLGL